MMQNFYIFWIIQVVDLQDFFSLCNAFFRHDYRPRLFIYSKIHVAFKTRNYFVDFVIQTRRFLSRSRYNKRRSCLVNQYAVNFINNSKIQLSLDNGVYIKLHIITQVVKTKFIVCSVSYIRAVCLFSFGIVYAA